MGLTPEQSDSLDKSLTRAARAALRLASDYEWHLEHRTPAPIDRFPEQVLALLDGEYWVRDGEWATHVYLPEPSTLDMLNEMRRLTRRPLVVFRDQIPPTSGYAFDDMLNDNRRTIALHPSHRALVEQGIRSGVLSVEVERAKS